MNWLTNVRWQELSRFPRLQGKLIEVVSDLLRERLGPTSQYVESLIAIQRAYINTNHPNFLGAAAAMSSVINDKQEKERKAALAEERRKREQRRLKELGGVNGTETPEEVEELEQNEKSHHLTVRGHHSKASRSMSPAVGRGIENGITSALNGRASSPTRFGTQPVGNAKDTFLNYFFGKEGGIPSSSSGQPAGTQGSRHVSQQNEPSITQSIRRGSESRPREHSTSTSRYESYPPRSLDDYDLNTTASDYGSSWVCLTFVRFRCNQLTLRSL